MARQILATIFGIVVAVMVVGVTEMFAHKIYPPPPGIDFHDQAQVAAMIKNLPAGAFAFVLAAWALGSFLGAFVAARIATRRHTLQAVIVGGVILAGVIFNLLAFSHPIWMGVLGLLLPLPCALLGARVGMKSA